MAGTNVEVLKNEMELGQATYFKLTWKYSMSLNNRSPPTANRGYTPIGLKRDKRWWPAEVNLNARFKPIGARFKPIGPTGLKRDPTGLKWVIQANPGPNRVQPRSNPGST